MPNIKLMTADDDTGFAPADHTHTAEDVGAATPEYVDNAVKGLATEKYVSDSLANVKIPMTVSQTDITAGTTELADGALYLVYE